LSAFRNRKNLVRLKSGRPWWGESGLEARALGEIASGKRGKKGWRLFRCAGNLFGRQKKTQFYRRHTRGGDGSSMQQGGFRAGGVCRATRTNALKQQKEKTIKAIHGKDMNWGLEKRQSFDNWRKEGGGKQNKKRERTCPAHRCKKSK